MYTFGNETSIEKDDDVVTLTLKNKDLPNSKIDIEALVSDQISAENIPPPELDYIPQVVQLENLVLADSPDCQEPITILIGADYYYDVVTGKIKHLSKKKYLAKPIDQLTSPLPSDRINQTPAFVLDSVGPLYVNKFGELQSPISFYLLAELPDPFSWNVSNMTINSFLLAFRIFIARRGSCKWSLLIWVNGGVPTYLWNLHHCRVDTLEVLGVEGLSQMSGDTGTPTVMLY
ncbi:integrase catalytic domain-containing protein [Trichonephila clavipes]|nr:integrase catalytic domain-containing protein [Trichonephila clavipes]